jgi:hypothetical protein
MAQKQIVPDSELREELDTESNPGSSEKPLDNLVIKSVSEFQDQLNKYIRNSMTQHQLNKYIRNIKSPIVSGKVDVDTGVGVPHVSQKLNEVPSGKWIVPKGTYNTGIEYLQAWQKANPLATKDDADSALLKALNSPKKRGK